MAILTAKFTDDYVEFMAKYQGQIGGITHAGWDHSITHFIYGEGGWIDSSGGRVRRLPVTSLRDEGTSLHEIDAIVDASRTTDVRYPANSRGFFSKNLTSANFTYVAPYTIEIECTLDAGEFNNDGFGNNPQLWEIGLYCDHPTIVDSFMMAYATFEMQTKTGGSPLTNTVRLKFRNQ